MYQSKEIFLSLYQSKPTQKKNSPIKSLNFETNIFEDYKKGAKFERNKRQESQLNSTQLNSKHQHLTYLLTMKFNIIATGICVIGSLAVASAAHVHDSSTAVQSTDAAAKSASTTTPTQTTQPGHSTVAPATSNGGFNFESFKHGLEELKDVKDLPAKMNDPNFIEYLKEKAKESKPIFPIYSVFVRLPFYETINEMLKNLTEIKKLEKSIKAQEKSPNSTFNKMFYGDLEKNKKSLEELKKKGFNSDNLKVYEDFMNKQKSLYDNTKARLGKK